jgi:hypothetical protein
MVRKEEYARRRQSLNGLCGVIPVDGNKLETMARKEKMTSKPSFSSGLKSLGGNGRGEQIWPASAPGRDTI